MRRVVESPSGIARLEAEDIYELLEEAYRVLREEPQLTRVNGRLLVVGDTHGDMLSSINAFRVEADVYAFLGDYVDRGPQQVENVNYLLARKVLEPDRVILLRGNHESPLMNYGYGFYRQVVYRYGVEVYRLYVRAFSHMPYAILANSSIFMVHGGIARDLKSMGDVDRIPKGDVIPSNQLAFELLWNDPDESVEFFAPSPRGEGAFLFGKAALLEFMRANGIELMIRAHEYFPTGVYTYFEGTLLSVFSCRYYPATTPKAILVTEGEWKPVMLD